MKYEPKSLSKWDRSHDISRFGEIKVTSMKVKSLFLINSVLAYLYTMGYFKEMKKDQNTSWNMNAFPWNETGKTSCKQSFVCV